MRRVAALLLCAVLGAETTRQTSIMEEIGDKALAGTTTAGAVRPDAVTGTSAIDGLLAAWLLDRRGSSEELLTWMEQRTDLQVGAHPAAAPGSSAAIKAGAPQVLSLAVDMGILSRSDNGQLVTFRGTPAGMAEAMFGWKLLHRPWDRLTGAATFDTSRGNTPGQLEASGRQLVSWSAGLQLWNARTPRKADWAGLAGTADAYVTARGQLMVAFAQWTALKDWQTDFSERLAREVDRALARGWLRPGDAAERVVQIARDAMEQLEGIHQPPAVVQALEVYARELREQLRAQNKLREARRKGPIVAVDWTVLRPANQPARWAATAIVQANTGRNGDVDFTANWTVHPRGAMQGAAEVAIPGKHGAVSGSVRYGRSQWNAGPSELVTQATWTMVLSGGMRLPVSVGFTRTSTTRSAAPLVTVGVQYTTDRWLHSSPR